MTGKRIGYVRVSTPEQSPDRQLEGIQVDKKFLEYASGKTTVRPMLQKMLEYAREDDIIIVHSIDRLARNIKDLLDIVDSLIKRGIQIQFIKENLLFCGEANHMSTLILSVFGAVAQFEAAIIHERLLEGIALAKAAGKYKGRKSQLTKERAEFIKAQLEMGTSKQGIARKLGISHSGMYKYLKELGLK